MESYEDFAIAAVAVGSLEVLDIEAMRVMYRVEMAGATFYERIAAGVDNDEAAQLLLRNGREERGHAERLRRAIGIKLGRPYDPDGVDLEPHGQPARDPRSIYCRVWSTRNRGRRRISTLGRERVRPRRAATAAADGRETRHSKRVAQAIEILERAAG